MYSVKNGDELSFFSAQCIDHQTETDFVNGITDVVDDIHVQVQWNLHTEQTPGVPTI